MYKQAGAKINEHTSISWLQKVNFSLTTPFDPSSLIDIDIDIDIDIVTLR